MKTTKQFKVKLDDKDKLVELLQEIYTEACKNIEEAQREINRISESTKLNEEIIDGKAKYAKAINDFIATKDRAIGRKLEIAKMLDSVIKYNGNIQQAFTEGEVPGSWEGMFISAAESTEANKPIEYKVR